MPKKDKQKNPQAEPKTPVTQVIHIHTKPDPEALEEFGDLQAMSTIADMNDLLAQEGYAHRFSVGRDDSGDLYFEVTDSEALTGWQDEVYSNLDANRLRDFWDDLPPSVGAFMTGIVTQAQHEGISAQNLADALIKYAATKHEDKPKSDTYPYEEGDFIVIGPEAFSDKDRKVISWQGANYYRPNAEPLVREDNPEAGVPFATDPTDGNITDAEEPGAAAGHA